MFFGHYSRPFFDCSAFNFDGISAVFTHEVMVVGISTEAIDRFTIISTQNIDDFVIY
jgi:hypothetical protein